MIVRLGFFFFFFLFYNFGGWGGGVESRTNLGKKNPCLVKRVKKKKKEERESQASMHGNYMDRWMVRGVILLF